MKTVLTPVTATRPIAPWRGGKRNLAKRIWAIIDPDDDHRTYAGPFVLYKNRKPSALVHHDIKKTWAF